MDLVVIQLLNGLVYGTLLFLLSAGLALIFGMMQVVSLVHGSLFMLGAFTGLAAGAATGSFWIGLMAAPLATAAVGLVIERGFLRPLYARGHLDQVFLTFGFTFVFSDVVKLLWGNNIRGMAPPALLEGSIPIFGAPFPVYRLFLIGVGLLLAAVIWLTIERSRVGAMVRASVDDRATAAGIGINVSLLFSLVFGLSAALAGLGGVVAGPVLGVYPGLDAEILIPAFIVIVIGGMSSLKGSFLGSLLVGEIDTFGKAFLPSAALFLIYTLMILVLLARPSGLFSSQR